MVRYALTFRHWWYRQSIRRQALYISVFAALLVFIPVHFLHGRPAVPQPPARTAAQPAPAAAPAPVAQASPAAAPAPSMTVIQPPSHGGLVRFAASQGHSSTQASGGSQAARPRGPILTYTVRQGDTLSSIAARFGTDFLSLEVANGLGESSLLHPGQKLTVLTQVGYVHTVRSGDTLSGIAAAAGVPVAKLAAANHLSLNGTLAIGTRLLVPVQPHPGSGGSAASRGGPGGHRAAPHHALRLNWPVRGPITSPFGWRRNPTGPGRNFHEGIDIGVPMRTPVHAAAAGTVEFAGWDGGFGYAVIINNGGAIKTLYAHNSRLIVHPGQRVSRGQVISYSGMTGNATGPHVHFGVYRHGTPVNPMTYLP